MTVILRPMRPDEFPAYLERGIASYAAEMVDHAGYTEDVAQRKSVADHDALFARGLETPGVSLFVVESDGEPVGSLVLGQRERHGRRHAFVYDVTIGLEHRGRGVGRQAMLLAEDEARARGFESIELNVFGGNEVARGLYHSLGYEETAVTMAKGLR